MEDSLSRQESTSSATGIDNKAIYYDVSPTIIFWVRFFNCGVLLMVIVACVLSAVQAQEITAYYLLTSNLVLSSLVCTVVNWWYRGGDLGVDKYWYIVVIGIVIMFQCVMTDIFVFKESAPVDVVTTTFRPANSSTPITMVTISNHTNKSFNYLYPVTQPIVVYRLP